MFVPRDPPGRLEAMARHVTTVRAALALLVALTALPSCAVRAPSAAVAADGLPTFGWSRPRMRAPSDERPAWLPSVPAEQQRIPVPGDLFRA